MSNIFAMKLNDGRNFGDKGIEYREEFVALGTITEITESIDSDTYQQTFIKHHHAGKDNRTVATSFYTPVINSNGTRNTFFFKRYEWNLVTKDELEKLSFADVKSRTIRSDVASNTGHAVGVYESFSEASWNIFRDYAIDNPDKSAIYLLVPEKVKVKRMAEAIPLMPGEKPKPQPSPEGQPAPAGDGDNKPDIPPMPGENGSVSVTDKNKEGPTVELEAGWWGTKNGEGK
jgi:hypothetical protein